MRLRRTRHRRFIAAEQLSYLLDMLLSLPVIRIFCDRLQPLFLTCFAGSSSVYGLVLPGIIRALTPFPFTVPALFYGRRTFFIMSLLDQLSLPEVWEHFYEYKTSLVSAGNAETRLRRFIDDAEYLPVCRKIREGAPFPLPKKAVISKLSSSKKRTVYIYPEPENTVLKLLTWLLLRRYDSLFSDGLYSFRPGRSAKDAIRHLRSVSGIREMYSYKADISNYFNSIPIPRFLPVLKETLSDDPELYLFLSSLLEETRVIDFEIVTEEKGIMAGTPLSAFYANLYLKDLDRRFEEAGITYARYSDDIILFAGSEEDTQKNALLLKTYLMEQGLKMNPDKEEFRSPSEGWTFLGFSYQDGRIDIAPASVKKIKGKMRRKSKALKRWADRNGQDPKRAAAAFIRVFNRKLLGTKKSGSSQETESMEELPENDLTWKHWYFSVINTDKSLREIDHYAAECVRYLLSGTRTKARFNVRYEDLKKLGYQSLVHAYHDHTHKHS